MPTAISRWCDRQLDRWTRWIDHHRYPVQSYLGYRIAVSAAVGVWAISWFGDLPTWFGTHGIIARDTASMLMEFEEIPRWQNWSPLWWTDRLAVYYAWLGVLMATMALVGLGIGGRTSVVVGLGLVIGWAHRATWLTGPVEPALVAFLGYLLLVRPPKAWKASRAAIMPDALRGASRVVRAARIHTWMLIAVSLLSQLAGIVWWRGEAVWWLASSGHSWAFGMPELFGHPMIINGLTHGLVLVQILSLWWLAGRSTRRAGIACGILVASGIALLADQTLYGVVLLAGLSAYLGNPNDVGNPNDGERPE